MLFPALPNVAVLLAVCASLVASLPLGAADGSAAGAARTTESVACSLAAIAECVADTGLESTICFAQVCAGAGADEALKLRATIPTAVAKREDQCNEENLLRCAVMEWREAAICFQELCL